MGHRLLPFSPARYHGRASSRPYFEGWYFKQSSEDGALVVIPGVFRGADSSGDTAFIQLIYGSPPRSHYITYPIYEFSCHSRRFELCIGGNRFSTKDVQLDIPQIGLSAKLHYTDHMPLRTNMFSPSIMGPFSYIPGLQCNHGVLSLWHSVQGEMCCNGEKMTFNNADGYIEKDWGEAFPESWIWMQCGSDGEMLMCSVASIPMKAFHYTGLIAVLCTGERQYRFATYNGGRVLGVIKREEGLTVELARGSYRLCIIARNTHFGSLKAPTKTGMNRDIQESVNCVFDVSLCHGAQTIYSGHFAQGGLEMLEPDMLLKNKASSLC